MQTKKTRINTKAFIGGMQTEAAHVIKAIANIDAISCLAVEVDEMDQVSQPLMTQQFQDFAYLFSSHKGNKYMQKYKHIRHLPHSLVVQCQAIFTLFSAVASRTEYQNLVMMDLPIPFAAYAETIQLFGDLMRDNKRTFNSSTLGIFQQPERSFPVAKDPPRSKRDRESDNSSAARQIKRTSNGESRHNKNEEAKKQGWLILENANLNFPNVLSKVPCKNHALVGRFCRFTPCRFHHWNFPLD